MLFDVFPHLSHTRTSVTKTRPCVGPYHPIEIILPQIIFKQPEN
jgi:hypothetical protein